MYTDPYLSQKEFAAICGTTQKRVGLILADAKLMVVGNGPTSKARAEGYIGLRYRVRAHSA
jgi:hypothetical protein